MPFIDHGAGGGGGFLPTMDLRTQPEETSSTLSDIGKIGATVGAGAGLLLAPLPTLGIMATTGGGALLADEEGAEAAFRTENTVGSLLSNRSGRYTGSYDPHYDPWEDISGTEFEPYWENFAKARNAEHAALIKQELIRERRDREYLESQGMLGFAQSMAAGIFDLPSLLPGGAIVRTAKGASKFRTALKVGAFGMGGAGLTEAVLRSTQKLRTPEESAMSIAGATLLSGVLGYGMASRMNKAEFARLGRRIEQDFTPPERAVSETKAQSSAAEPETDASLAADRDFLRRQTGWQDELETELRQIGREILPHDESIKLELVDEIPIEPGKVTGEELYAIERDDGGDFGIGIAAREGLSEPGTVSAETGGEPAGGRPVTGAPAGEGAAPGTGGAEGIPGAEYRLAGERGAARGEDVEAARAERPKTEPAKIPAPKAISGTESFALEGFTGTRNAAVPPSGKVATRVYRVYPEDVTVERNKSPLKSLGEPLGKVRISQHPDGRWEVTNVEISKPLRRQGLASQLYDRIESDLGIRMQPSGYLEPDGFAFWQNRNPEAVKFHRFSKMNGYYLSPRQIRRQLAFINDEIARGVEPEQRTMWERERSELLGLWDDLPAEAKTKGALAQMFAIRAFHGTPHEFKRFDISRIGTGEGTQEQGYGIYLSAHAEIGEGYSLTLGAHKATVDGAPVGDDLDLQAFAVAKISGTDGYGRTIDEIVAGQEEALRRAEAITPRRDDLIAEAETRLEKAIRVRDGDVKAGGVLYEVEINAEVEQLLDHARPVGEQTGILPTLKKIYSQNGIDDSNLEQQYGSEVYDSIAYAAGSERQASMLLMNEGIPGSSYDLGGYTHYVIFDDSILKITKKNGKPVTGEERQGIIDQMFALRKEKGAEPPLRINAEGLVMRLPHQTEWGDPRFNPQDRERALGRLREIQTLSVRNASWTDLVQAADDINHITAQLFYYSPDFPENFLKETWESGFYFEDDVDFNLPTTMRQPFFTADDLPADITDFAREGRAAIEHLVSSRRAGVKPLLHYNVRTEPKPRKARMPEPEKIAESQKSGFYFKAGRELANVPDAIFEQGGQAVINTLEKAGVKKAEIDHFRLRQLADKKKVTRAEFESRIAERIFDFRRKTSWLNPERSGATYELGGTRAFTGPRIPGRGVYFERLMAFPKKLAGGEPFAPGRFKSPHWEDVQKGTWASWRGSTRDLPEWGNVLIGEEGQSDFMQGALGRGDDFTGRRPRIKMEDYQTFLKDRPKYVKAHDAISREINSILGELEVPIRERGRLRQSLEDRFHEGRKANAQDDLQSRIEAWSEDNADNVTARKNMNNSLQRIRGIIEKTPEFFITDARKKYLKTESSFTPESPVDQSYVRTMVRDLLFLATEKNADAIAISTSDTTYRIQVNKVTSASHFYDNQLRPALEKELRRLTGDGSIKLEKIKLPKAIGGPKREKPYTIWIAKLSPETREKIRTEGQPMFTLRGFYSPAIRAAEKISQKKGTGEQFLKQIMKVPGVRKDELEWMGLEEFLKDKKSITRDEVLAFMRAHQIEKEPIAEGKFDPYTQTITISRAALDPVAALHHEAVHALKARGLFTKAEWSTLAAAARSEGWLDVPEIKHYQEIYGRPIEDENIIEEAVALAYQRHISGGDVQEGLIRQIFERLALYLKRVANALHGRGILTEQDIFRAIRRGEIGARAAPGRRGAPGTGGMTAVGAQASQEGDVRLKSAFGLEKALEFVSPMMRLQNSPARAARGWAAELAETALTYEDHKAWIPTARGGAELGQPGSVETRVKLYDTNIAKAFEGLDNLFRKYRKATTRRIAGDLTVMSLKDSIFGAPPDKMTYREFREAVAFAGRREDKHDIPEVAEAAQLLRKEVYDPLLKRAIELGLLPDDVKPETAASYINRVYNKERIIAERPEFRDVIVQWLQEHEVQNARIRGRLDQLLKEFSKVPREVRGGKGGPELPVLRRLREQIEEQIKLYRDNAVDRIKARLAERDAATGEDAFNAEQSQKIDDLVIEKAREAMRQSGKETNELIDTADQIIDRILGTPEGRLPYDAALDQETLYGVGGFAKRGPLATREFMIPDIRIEQWLENDVDVLLRAYVHTMAPDIELTARFGSTDMRLQFKEILEEYAKLEAATDDPQIRSRLEEQKKQDFINLGAIRDRLRRTYALPEDPDSIMVRSIRGLMTFNYMRMLGGITISALPDIARFVHTNGVVRTFGDGLIPLFRNFAAYKKAGDEAKWLSGALELITDNRAMRIADITDTFGRHTKFERALQSASRQFGMVSLMAPWNAVMKQLAGTLTMTRILRAADRLVSGKALKQKDIEYFADLGISEGALRRIGKQFQKHGHKENNIWSANTAEWDAGMRSAIEALRVALRKEVDRTIITPSLGEKPRFMSTLTGSFLMQFKSFAISSTQKMLISGLQQKDLNALNAAVLAMALGGLTHIIKGSIAGRAVEIDWQNDDDVRQFMANAFDRSGTAGVLMEFNNIAEKVTDGRLGLAALTGKPISRYASRNVTGSLAGPGFGLAEDSIRALNSAFGKDEWTQRDTHNVRQLLPYNNLFYFRSIFDRAEQGINDYFGVRERAR